MPFNRAREVRKYRRRGRRGNSRADGRDSKRPGARAGGSMPRTGTRGVGGVVSSVVAANCRVERARARAARGELRRHPGLRASSTSPRRCGAGAFKDGEAARSRRGNSTLCGIAIRSRGRAAKSYEAFRRAQTSSLKVSHRRGCWE